MFDKTMIFYGKSIRKEENTVKEKKGRKARG